MLAEQELLESIKWYNEQSTGLGTRFSLAVKRMIEKIKVSTEIYSYAKKPFREASVPIFPYLIIYIYSSEKKIIYIASVFHAHKNPNQKFRKI